jgi:hypothetical protein
MDCHVDRSRTCWTRERRHGIILLFTWPLFAAVSLFMGWLWVVQPNGLLGVRHPCRGRSGYPDLPSSASSARSLRLASLALICRRRTG